jgi:hypothetical protein
MRVLRNLQRFAIQNSPSLLTAVGALGVVTTSVLTAKASFRAVRIIDQERWRRDEESTVPTNPADLVSSREAAELVWREFVPPAVVGVVTLAAIIGANHIGGRRAAAFATAYKLSEKMAEEYRQKVVDTIGREKEDLLRGELTKDRVERVPGVETIVLGEGEVVFYDEWSGRAFKKTIDEVANAVNQLNYQINQSWCASLTEFYDLLGLPKTRVSDDYGWNSDELLEPYYSSTLLEDVRPARSISFNVQPFQNYNKGHH